jgi:hypothetical protein
MAADREYSAHQKGIIRRFYEHRDTLALQKLAEIVSNLYVETSEARINRSWKAAHAQLLAAGVSKSRADAILAERDLGALAKVVTELT